MTKEEVVALKPCPFCGGTDLLQTDKVVPENAVATELPDGEAPDEWFVVCGMCSAMAPLTPSAQESHAAWNKRTEGV